MKIKLLFYVLCFCMAFVGVSAQASLPAPKMGAKFLILCMSGESAGECKAAHNVEQTFDAKYGSDYVQYIDASTSTALEVQNYLTNSAYSAFFGQLNYFMIAATHGLEDQSDPYHYAGTSFYWQCDESGSNCQQELSTKDLTHMQLSSLKIAFFDDCNTHGTADDVDYHFPDDNSATAWVHLYNKSAFAIGFTHPTNFPGTQDLMQCVWTGVAANYAASSSAQQLSQIINQCKQQVPTAQIPGNNQVLPGTLYFTGTDSANLSTGTVQYIDIFQNPYASATLNLNGKQVLLPAVSGNDQLEKSDFLAAFGDINQLIASRQLNQIQLKISSDAPAIACKNLDDSTQTPIKFDSQFNALDIIIGLIPGQVPTCSFTYDYRTQ